MLCCGYCFRYFKNISSKVDIEFILWCSILMDCSCFFLIRLEINEWLWLNGYLTFVGIPCMKALYYLYLCDSISQWYMCCFNHLLDLKCWFRLSVLVKFISERSLSERKIQFLSKWFLLLPWDYLPQPWVYFEW